MAAPTDHGSQQALAPPLVGREREQATLRAALAATLAEASEQGMLGLIGRCYDLAETPPYGPWREVFSRVPRSAGPPGLPAAVLPLEDGGEAPSSQGAIIARVVDYLACLAAGQPLVLLLDDLHWADTASLDLLRFLARQLADIPLLLLAPYRSDELTRRHPLYQLLPTLVREANAARLDLRPLAPADVALIAQARYDLLDREAQTLADYLLARSEGNPFFLGELLRTLEETRILTRAASGWQLGELTAVGVPPPLRQVLDGRLDRLGEDARAALEVAAVLGHEVPIAHWQAVASTDEADLGATIERATAARLIGAATDGLGVRFAHALIREALYEGTAVMRRRHLHRRSGEVLAATAGPDPDAVAAHFQRAGDGRAVPWLVRAGERAQLAYAWLTAIARYEAALALLEASGGDLAERGWLRYRIARLQRMHLPRQGIASLDEALRIAALVGDGALAAAARYTRGLCAFYLVDYLVAIDDMTAGCDALEALSPDEQARLDLGPDERGVPTITNPRGLLVAALALSGRVREAIAMGEATRAGSARHTPLGELGWAHQADLPSALGLAYAHAGCPDAAREALARARAIHRTIGHHSTHAAITFSELIALSLPYRTERRDEHWRLVDEASDAAERARATTGERGGQLAAIPVLLLHGRWAEARVEAEAVVRDRATNAWRDTIAGLLGELLRDQGEAGAAWAHVQACLPDGAGTAPGRLKLESTLALLRLGIRLLLDGDDRPAAGAWLAAYERWLAWSGAILGKSEGEALRARYHRQAGDAPLARDHAERALRHASEPRQPLALLAAHRLLGELGTAEGRHDNAAAHLAEALALGEACAAPYERALTLLALADLRAAAGDRAEAATALDGARALLDPLGARPALARAAALAARLASPVAPPRAYPAGLSAREAEVLGLVARGLPTAEIAARLFLSPRTINTHLTNIYTKLGVNGRPAATRFAIEHGLA